MTDRELWVKTCKTVGAMTGGTLLLLGSMSLILMLVVGRPSAASPEAAGASTGADVGKVDTVPPPAVRSPRHGTGTHERPGESI